MTLIRDHLTVDRVEAITELVNGFGRAKLPLVVKDRLSADDIVGYARDEAFYSLLLQVGYLTYDPRRPAPTDGSEEAEYDVYLPNRELQSVWRQFILMDVTGHTPSTIRGTFDLIADPERFDPALTRLIDNQLSFHDFDPDEPERTHHVFLAALLAAVGIPFRSNREAGFGRYDLMALFPDKSVVFEFKRATDAAGLDQAAEAAIQQILDRDYAREAPEGLPVYAVGVAFVGKKALVRSRPVSEV
jgi:hypothetical protein